MDRKWEVREEVLRLNFRIRIYKEFCGSVVCDQKEKKNSYVVIIRWLNEVQFMDTM